MTDIFISYNEHDRAQARQVAAVLESVGWTVWWDRRIPAGETWRSVLEDALEEMRCMVVLWSGHSIESEWVYEEASEGRRLGKLIPVMLEAVRPPAGFREIQAADLTGWDGSREFEGMRMLLADLENFLGKPAPPAGDTSDKRDAERKTVPEERESAWWQSRKLIASAVAGALVALGGAAYFSHSPRIPAVVAPEAKAPVPAAPQTPPQEKPGPTTAAPKTEVPPEKSAPPPSPVTELPPRIVARHPVATNPVSKHSALSPAATRCADLLARTQLGESLSEKSLAYYDKECRQ